MAVSRRFHNVQGPAGRGAHAFDQVASMTCTGLFPQLGEQPLTPANTAILWDADKLTKLGLPQTAMPLCGPHAQGRTLAERQALVHNYVHSWIDRTVEGMNTEPARETAKDRYQQMKDFLELWSESVQSE